MRQVVYSLHDWLACLLVVLLLAFSDTVFSQVADRGQTSAIAPAIRQHMLDTIVPASDALFAAANQDSLNAHVWADLTANTLKLAKSAQWLGRHKPLAREQQWLQAAKQLHSASVKAARAVQAKNIDLLGQAGDQVYQACDNCHRQFLNKAAASAP
jgi:hypothetical protein